MSPALRQPQLLPKSEVFHHRKNAAPNYPARSHTTIEDLNDHDTLRHDLLWQTAVHRDTPLASSPTLCRLEKRPDFQIAVAMHEILVEKFIASFRKTPKRLILDFNATDDRVHGHREGPR